MRILLTAILGLSMAACTVGATGDDGSNPGDDTPPGDDNPPGDDGNPPPPTPRVAVAMTPATIDSELGSIANDFTITVTGSGTFSGPVALAFTGVPADWNAALDNTTVTVPTDGTATAILNIRVPTDAIAATASIQVTATSTAAPATLATPGTLNVLNQVTLHIPNGAGGNPAAHGLPATLTVRSGATVRIQNDDASVGTHRIHGDGVFPHQDDPGSGVGGVYEVLMTDTGNGSFYCHDHGDGGNPVALTVQ